MRITALTIENFKGIKDPVRVELKPITLLFGPNSAGKSTVIQALHYAREIFERHNLNPDRTLLGGETVDLGGFESLVYQHDLSLPIRFKLELDLSQDDLPRYLEGYEELGLMEWEESDLWRIPPAVKSAWVEIVVRWSSFIEAPLLTTYCVGVNDEELAAIETTDDGRQVNFTRLYSFNPIFLRGSSPEEARKTAARLFGGDEELTAEDMEALGDVFIRLFELLNTEGGVPGVTKPIALAGQKSALPNWGTPLKFHSSMWNKDVSYLEEGAFIQLLSSLIVGPGELIRDALRSFCYVGPLREVPKRGHRPTTSPDNSRWANGLAAYDSLFYAENAFIDQINQWLTSDQRLNSGYSVDVKQYRELATDDPLMLALQQDRLLDDDADFRSGILQLPVKRRLLIRDEKRNVELEPQDIGVGISQVLPVVVAALSYKSGFVAVEQPELHIHPALQVALGDLFIEQINTNQDLIFILETHSEHLLLRLLRRIRETTNGEHPPGAYPFMASQLGVNYIEVPVDKVEVRQLEVSSDGDSAGEWPKGFFEERAGELF